MDIEFIENYIVIRFYVTASNKDQTFEIIIPIECILNIFEEDL